MKKVKNDPIDMGQMDLFPDDGNPSGNLLGTRPKSTTSSPKGKLLAVSPHQIVVPSGTTRKFHDHEELTFLSLSIAKHGMLHPVLCSYREGNLTLIAGERRLKAAIIAELPQIPVLIIKNNNDATELSLVENLVRKDLNAVEEAEALFTLKELKGYSLEELGVIAGKAVATLSEILSIARLPLEIRDDCRCNSSMPRDILVLIARLPGEEILSTYNDYKKGVVSRDDLRGVARKQKNRAKEKQHNSDRIVFNFSKSLSKLDTSSLDDQQKDRLRDKLEKLMETIRQTLDTL